MAYIKKRVTYSHRIITSQLREALKSFIIKKNYSIADAASKFDMDESHAENILYSKNPSNKQIAHAFEIYDKGFPLIMACVASGVSPAVFKKARLDKDSKQYRPMRW